MDFPPVSIRPEIMMALAASSLVVESERVARELVPFKEQNDLVGGSHCLIVNTAEGNANDDFMIGIVQDASLHAHQFPDWESRVSLKGYVLVEYYGKHTGSGLGWFPRVRLMPLTEERFNEMHGYLDDKFPPEIPEWLRDSVKSYNSKLQEMSPNVMPKRVVCGNCKGDNVFLHTVHSTRNAFLAGEKEVDGKMVYSAISDSNSNCITHQHLHCEDCDFIAELTDDQIDPH